MGLFRAAAGQLGFATVGVERLRILGGGAVSHLWQTSDTAQLQMGASQDLVLARAGAGQLNITNAVVATTGIGFDVATDAVLKVRTRAQSAFAALQCGAITTVGSIVTSGVTGVSAIVASGRATAQTGANASVSTFTVGAADASFEVSANVLVTTSTTHSFTVTCAYTDEGNTARTLTLGFTQLSGATFLTAITNVTGAGPYESPTYHLRCKAATAITIATTGTFTTVTYNVEGVVKQTA